MVLRDFEKGRFPINNLSPVIAIGTEGSTLTAKNRSELKKLANWCKLSMLLGVWPGKKNTDFFSLDPESYKDIPVPPAGHETIDDAEKISVVFLDTENFSHVKYSIGSNLPVICHDKDLFDYLKKTGLRHSVAYENL